MSERGRGEFWAFMAGLLAGGVAAILYAPAKGEDTRKKIRETAEDAYHKGEDYYEKGMTEAERVYHEGRNKAEKIYSDGKHKVEEVVDAVSGKTRGKGKKEPEPSSSLADSIAVAGDGAVGIAVAVALSSEVSRVILAGPPGTTETMGSFSVPHWRKDPVEILHTAIDHIPPVDITIAALKAYDIREASVHIPSPVICLSNGMGLSSQWGPFPFPVEYAPLTTGFRKTGHHSVEVSPGRVFCRTGGMAWNLFKDTLPGVIGVEDIAPHRWAKWYANSIINPIGALTGLPNNRLEDSPMGHFIEELEQELAPLMPTEESLSLGKGMLHWLLENSPNRCSMLQDLENHRPTEIDFLTGYAVENMPGLCPVASYLTSEIDSRT